MFRLQQWTSRNMGYSLWWLEEWTPSPHSLQGRWSAITKKLGRDSMDALLERTQCPSKPHAMFREAAGIKGTEKNFHDAGDAERIISLENSFR